MQLDCSLPSVWKEYVYLCVCVCVQVWHVPCGGVTYGDQNLVFIANDWHTALLPVYLQVSTHEHQQ